MPIFYHPSDMRVIGDKFLLLYQYSHHIRELSFFSSIDILFSTSGKRTF
ncbi:hypothetical protein F544_1610 [Bibersteinia trehalosi USDA-ARS-USMARC-190]|uniref:Uncharacterized protein n=1 Tax=Bibersteinia trehalosi USDA-ARS-USMARC-190 TaxID=1263832 RepID=W0R3S9_BIBTR|nr:hypothetical protein F544_1610 [Bibersteinia trehalosi USDA-ARS-USMARC-190]